MLQNERLTDKVKYLEGDYYLKGKELLEPSDPYAKLIEDHTRLKAEKEELVKNKKNVNERLAKANKKINELEAMEEDELLTKVGGVWLCCVTRS